MGDMSRATATESGPRVAFREPLLERKEHLASALSIRSSSHLQHLLEEVDAALERLSHGSFGVCQSCSGSIEPERLERDPLVMVCLDCLSPGEHRALEHDLELAGRIQMGLLPKRDLSTAGWQVHVAYQPLGTVGGDYVDLVEGVGARESLFFALGDISGKGVAAALLMSNLQALIRSSLATHSGLEDLVITTNRMFCNATPANAFATLVAGEMTQEGAVQIANAGHCPVLLKRASSVELLQSSATPLGMFCAGSFPVDEVVLGAGDALFLFSDGLSEGADAHGEEFGVHRICEALEGTQGESPAEIVEAVLAEYAAFTSDLTPVDDLSVMVLQRS